MKIPSGRTTESVARLGGVLVARGMGAAPFLSGHATVAEASNHDSGGVIHLSAAPGTHRERARPNR
jgi:hypothetical protein